MSKTSIEWTDATWNPVRGCSRVSEGCRNCYAEKIASRFSKTGDKFHGFAADGKWTGRVELIPEKLEEPLRWKKPRRVFVNSMSDLFHESLPFEDIERVFDVMTEAGTHTFQVLTKRPNRMVEFISWYERRNSDDSVGMHWHAGNIKNIWLGTSVEDQKTADERIPLLLQTPAAVRFVSYEPALGPVNFREIALPIELSLSRVNPSPPHINALTTHDDDHFYNDHAALDWIIIGGESGPGARPFDLAWARSTIVQCREAGVSCFVKQLGSYPILDTRYIRPGETRRLRDRKGGDWEEWPADIRIREFPDESTVRKAMGAVR